MERVGTLINKLQKQYTEQQHSAQLLNTIQLLIAELQQVDAVQQIGKVSVTLPSFYLYNTSANLSTEQIITVAENNNEVISNVEESIIENLQPLIVTETTTKNNLLDTITRKEEETVWSLDPMVHIPTFAHQYTKEEVVELNEKLLVKENNLNDTLKVDKTEVASVLQTSPLKDLKKAIGINDRFLFMNELFKGDEALYERSIKTINSFNVYVEAEYWVQQELITKIGWNEKSETVQSFIQLVKRRFS